jgi:LPXTG-motif cell wall-anchored protein
MLDIRVNGYGGYKIIQKTDFESIYFKGEKVLNVADITKFKILTHVLTKEWEWNVKSTKLVEGKNKIIIEIKKDKKIFKMIVTVVVEYPQTTAETTATPETTTTIETTTDITTPNTTSDTTADTTPVNTDVATPTATANKADVDKMPNTGEENPIIYFITGFIIIAAGGLLFKKFVLN